MRSILKLTATVLLLVLVPSLVSGNFVVTNANDNSVIISQVFIVFLVMFIFLGSMSLIKKYERKTLEFIKSSDDVEDLRSLREKRITYKSKAAITKAILIKEPSEAEANLLKKYTNQVADMSHYYSTFINGATSKNREEYKNRRDNFNKKYGHKKFVYPNFRENLKTSIKWLIAFFTLAILSNMLGKTVTSKEVFAVYFLSQMLLLGAYMINTILWLSRTVKSYWDREFI